MVILAKEITKRKGGKTWENDETTTTTQTTDSTNTDKPKLKNNINSERERDLFSTCAVRKPHTWRSPAAQPEP